MINMIGIGFLEFVLLALFGLVIGMLLRFVFDWLKRNV